MIPASSYFTVYLIVVTLLTIVVSTIYGGYSDKRLDKTIRTNYWPTFFVAVAFTLFIGFRPISGVFIDMMNYFERYHFISHRPFVFNADVNNLIYDNLELYLATHHYDIRLLYVLMAVIYFMGMFLAFRKMFPKDSMYMLVIYLGAFSTFSFGTNGIKAGAAASLFLCALAYHRNLKYLILFCLLTLGFHHSMILPVAALGIAFFYRNTKVIAIIWIICVLLSAAHFTYFQSIFNSMADEQGQGYLSSVDSEYSHGFRPDFIFYSMFPLFSAYFAFRKGYQSRTYRLLLNTYLITNAIWMLCMYASFTNRIAYLSWLMLPVVLVYPFFDKKFTQNQYGKLNIVAWGHLGFTLAMFILYYGLLK